MQKASISNSQHCWAASEFSNFNLPDARLNKRGIKIVSDFATNPTKSIPQATRTWSQAKATYRFFDNDRFTAKELLKPHQEKTSERISREPVVLIVQDTTGLNYDHHPETEGLGLVGTGSNGALGMWLHTSLSFAPTGMPLGIVETKTWVRDPKEFGKAARRHKRSIEQKESFRWLESFMATLGLAKQHPQTKFINIADREGDIYEVFIEAAKNPDVGVLVRARHPRKDRSGKTIEQLLESKPAAGTIEVEVPRKPGKRARRATLEIYYTPLLLKPPTNKKSGPSLDLWVVEAREINPPAGEKGLFLRLFTNLRIESFEQAVQTVGYYTKRWGIEEYHRILKSGCRVEDRQLETLEGLTKALMFDAVIAYRVLSLNRIAREDQTIKANEHFSEDEMLALKETFPKKHQEDLTVKEAVRLIAQLGGFLARKGDGEPGTMTLWRGLETLEQIVFGVRIGRNVGNA